MPIIDSQQSIIAGTCNYTTFPSGGPYGMVWVEMENTKYDNNLLENILTYKSK